MDKPHFKYRTYKGEGYLVDSELEEIVLKTDDGRNMYVGKYGEFRYKIDGPQEGYVLHQPPTAIFYREQYPEKYVNDPRFKTCLT